MANGLLGACSCFSDTLLAASQRKHPLLRNLKELTPIDDRLTTRGVRIPVCSRVFSRIRRSAPPIS
jgi:hypothetical protein